MSSTENEVSEETEHLVEQCEDEENLLVRSTETPPISTYKCRLEWAVFLISVSSSLSATIFQDHVLYQVCTSVFGYNQSVCTDVELDDNDTQSNEIENIIQPYASKIFMVDSLIQAVCPAFIVLFLGAWSDKFGRKPLLLSACIGFLCFHIIRTIVAIISLNIDVNPWFYITASIPYSFSGGWCVLTSAAFCYVTDLTNFKERPYRIWMMSVPYGLGFAAGQVLSMYLYSVVPAVVIFAISAAIQLCALLFIILVIKESVKSEVMAETSKFDGLLDWELVKDMIRTVLAPRANYDRAIIWCIILTAAAVMFDMEGSSNVLFLFVRVQFGWSVQDYNFFKAISIPIDIVGTTVGLVVLQRWLGFKLTALTMLALFSGIVDSAFYAAATAPWYMYAAAGCSFLFGVTLPMCQAMLSNVVPLTETGKVFALMTALQAIAPLIAAPLFTFVYNSTLATYPGAFNLIGVILCFLCFLAITFVHIVELHHPNVNKAKISRHM